MSRSLARNYAIVTLGLSAFFAWLASLVSGSPRGAVDPRELLPSLFALVLLTAVVWLLMLVTRHRDRAFVLLATIFLATRAVHAVVYIGVNRLQGLRVTWPAA